MHGGNRFIHGLANAFRVYKFQMSEDLPDEMLDKIKEIPVTSQDIFELSALFKSPGMTRKDLNNGKLHQRIKGSYLDGEVEKRQLRKADVLVDFLRFMDQEYGPNWWTRF